ncbi:MAG: bifunctional protein-serine/threonine kinase/phosphatase [Burkholderiaceae bacterium]
MALEVAFGWCSHPGPRSVNEDWATAAVGKGRDQDRGAIVAIADGVSTGGDGREAARTSAMTVVLDYFSAPDSWDTSVVLDRLIDAQNAWLAAHNRCRRATAQGGRAAIAMTTLTTVTLRGQVWTVAHVGDTRAWLIRGDDCIQLTQDHSFSETFQSSRLTRALGLDDRVRIDFVQGELRKGDIFLLTSDGVHGVLGRAVLSKLARDSDVQGACDAIVAAARKAGTPDNATALMVRIGALIERGFDGALAASRRLPGLPTLKPGDAVDGFTIESLLADTGVHRLYRAHTTGGDRKVLLKALHPSRAGDEQERAMLAHEAWLSSRIGRADPPRGEAGFVAVLPAESRSAQYIAFDWHEGVTLQALLKSGTPMDVADVVAAAIAIARALGRLHRTGVIHRDVKPDNLLRSDDGRWWILDLGAALSGSDPPELRLLRAGTPSYMNPEQWGRDGRGPQPADEASDLYALGVTLYQWLTTRLPYGQVVPFQAGRFRHDPKPPSRLRPDVPVWLDSVVLRSVALDARLRFETAEELVLALERGAARPLATLAPTPLAARDPTALWKIALGMSVLLNLLLMYWLLFLPR